MLEKHNQFEQMLLCMEKENAAGPCSHHIHSLVQFKDNIPEPTLKRLLDRWVLKFYKKDEGAIKNDYATKAAIDVRTCYCVKEDYLSKHITSTHYVGLDEFDVDACTAALPDQVQQTNLQPTKSDRVINAVWASYSALWIKYAPDDDSIRSAWTWFYHATNTSIIECMPDTRKQTQFVEQLQRFRTGDLDFSMAAIRSIKAYDEALIHDENFPGYDIKVLKEEPKKRKHGSISQGPVHGK